MRAILKIVAWLVGASVLLTAVLLAWATARGNFTWFVLARDARLSIGGKAAQGRVFQGHGKMYNRSWQTVIVTRNANGGRQSYWIELPSNWSRGSVSGCRSWNPPRLPWFPVSIFTSPCCFVVPENEPRPEPPKRDLKTGPTSVEFNADDGRRVRAEW
jgi:hypothetical protein